MSLLLGDSWTSTPQAEGPPGIELDHRSDGWGEVWLLWDPATDSTILKFDCPSENVSETVIVPGDQALNAFYHPGPHLGR